VLTCVSSECRVSSLMSLLATTIACVKPGALNLPQSRVKENHGNDRRAKHGNVDIAHRSAAQSKMLRHILDW